VCLSDFHNKKILPEFFLFHLLLEGISEHVCAVCLALCSGMQGQPQVNTVFVHSMSKCHLMVCMLRHFPSGVVVITYVMCLTN